MIKLSTNFILLTGLFALTSCVPPGEPVATAVLPTPIAMTVTMEPTVTMADPLVEILPEGDGLSTIAPTATITLTPTPTLTPGPIPLFPEGCMDVLEVGLEQVRQTICVAGFVHSAKQVRGDYYIAFSSDQTTFYMVGYDWPGKEDLKPGDCVYATGMVERLGSTPMMAVTQFMLKSCNPKSLLPTPPPPASLPEDCHYALEITLADYGLVFCVGGTVSHIVTYEDVYEIYFYANQTVGLRFVIYDIPSGERGVNPGECIFVRDKRVDRIGQRLVMVVRPREILRCPAP